MKAYSVGGSDQFTQRGTHPGVPYFTCAVEGTSISNTGFLAYLLKDGDPAAVSTLLYRKTMRTLALGYPEEICYQAPRIVLQYIPAPS